jgi:hypothetical protein
MKLKFIEKSKNGYAIITDRKNTYAVVWQDSYTWKYVARALTLDAAKNMFFLKAL